MSASLNTTLHLTGALRGKTVVLGGYPFVDGRFTVSGSLENVSGLIKYLGRSYQAYPEGSVELREAQERDRREANRGVRGANGNDSDRDKAASNDGVDGADGSGTSQAGGSDDGETGVNGSGGSTSGLSDRGGRPDAGDADESDESGPYGEVRKALKRLDHTNDDDWTGDDRPAVARVTEILGRQINRAEIDAAAPDFRRVKR